MAIYDLEYSFTRRVNVNELDPAYQETFTLSQLRKVFGPANVIELVYVGAKDEDGNPYPPVDENAESA